MIKRDDLIKELKEEQKLRTMIRRGIKIVLERKEKHEQQEMLEEQRLRGLIRGLITGFGRIPTADPDELQGANFAEDAWNDVEKQILEPYEDLIAPADAEAFYDYGLTNLKLYFDRFEDELSEDPGEEPESPDYNEPAAVSTDEDSFGL